MKIILDYVPTFNPSAKTLDFTGFSAFEIKKLFAVINVTRNQMIYATGQASLGLASIAGAVITLAFDTTSHSAGDVLQVIYDDEDFIQKTRDQALNDMVLELKNVTDALASFTNQLARQSPQLDTQSRVQVRLSALDSTVTLANLTNLNNYGSGNAARIPWDSANTGALHIYNQITVS